MTTQPSNAPLAASPDRPSAFLATALLVDDLAIPRDSPAKHKLAVAAAEAVKPAAEEDASFEDLLPAVARSKSDISAELLQSDKSSDRDDQKFDRVDTHDLIEAFADHGIVCAALTPHSTENSGVDDPDRRRVTALAARTDIVIIDWFLRAAPSSGPPLSSSFLSSRGLIEEVLRQDRDRGGRLRLLCVYTGDSDLDGVHRQLEELVGEVHGKGNVASSGQRVVVGPHLRIVLVAKPSNENPDARPVAERDLAKHLVDEFGRFANGLLRTVALTGLAAVRDNAHRLLARFEADMDPAFLSHRALVGPTEGAQFAVELLGDELAATLVAAGAGASLTPSCLDATIDRVLPAGAEGRGIPGSRTGMKILEMKTSIARQLLQKGRGDAGLKNCDFPIAKIENAASVTMLCFDGDRDHARLQAQKQDLALAVLSCLARDPRLESVNQPPPVLTLGSILMLDVEGEKSNYYLCVQPLCDSVRKTNLAPFPLLPLKSVEEGGRFDLTVPNPSNSDEVLCLSSRAGLADLKIVEFQPDRETETVQGVRAEGDGAIWKFHAMNKGEEIYYGWLGDLRPAIAMRVAAALGQSASRVGLTESEFQRVWSKA